MTISGHCAGLKQQQVAPAVQHFDTALSTLERVEDLGKGKEEKKIPLNPFDIQELERTNVEPDLMTSGEKKTALGCVSGWTTPNLGSVSKTCRKSEIVLVFTCLSVFPAKPVITAIIPVRKMSTANTPSPSCKQITLRRS